MVDYFATTRNGHRLLDLYDRESNSLDIRSNGLYPSNVLSNLCNNGFCFDGIACNSMEGFLQSLKYQDMDKQQDICSMIGGGARKQSNKEWQTDQIVWWKGEAYDRQGEDFRKLIRRAYQAMFDQNEQFRAALMQTRGIILIHSCGEENPYKTILTEQEFCQILMEIRDNYDKRNRRVKRKKHILVDDNGQLYEVTKLQKDYNVTSSDEVLQLGSEEFPDWNSVIEYLVKDSPIP